MPTDPLAAIKAALPLASSRLVPIVAEGDSTFAGQVRDNGLPYYSPMTRLRARLVAAGVPDGGHGVMNGTYDTSSVSGEPSDAGVLIEPTYNITNGQNLKGNYTGSINTPGAVYRAAVYGSRVRVSWALYGSATVLDIDIDGTTTRVTTGTKTNAGGTADGNWQAGGYRLFAGLSYGRHVVTVTLVSGQMSVLIEGTRNTGAVIHNFAARGEQAVGTPWHQMQDWAGLQVTSAAPVVPAAVDTAAGSHAPLLGIFAMGINDQQGNSGTDTSAAYGAKAYDFARAFVAAGASAIICAPWFESANQAQLAANYRAAAVSAAASAGALFLDLGPNGALAGKTGDLGGANSNPHLTQLGYTYQGDYIADAILAGYTGQAVSVQPVRGRTVLGYRLAGSTRTLVTTRRPTA